MPNLALSLEIAARTPPAGTIHLTEDFAAALHAGSPPGARKTELASELECELEGGGFADPIPLYALKR